MVKDKPKVREIGEVRAIKEYLFHLEGNPVEQALAIKNLIDGGMTQREIGRLMGWAQSSIASRLRLLRLHPKLRERAMRGELSKSVCYELAGMPLEEQERYVDEERVLLKEVEQRRRKLALTKEVMDVLNTPLQPEKLKSVRCPKCGFEFEP